MKKSKKLVYIDNFKEDGELLQCLLARIINEVPLAIGGGKWGEAGYQILRI